LFGYTGETEFCDKFRKGEADIDGLDIDNDVKIFLHQLQQKQNDPPKISATMTQEQLKQGFKLWPENRSTSPKGRHLGLYKSWLFKKPTAQPQEEMPMSPCL
jgi:hypothetical protein